LPVVQHENPLEERIPVFVEMSGVGAHATPVGDLHIFLGLVKLCQRQLAISGTLEKPRNVHRTCQIDKILPASRAETNRCQGSVKLQRTGTRCFTRQRKQQRARMATSAAVSMGDRSGRAGHAKGTVSVLRFVACAILRQSDIAVPESRSEPAPDRRHSASPHSIWPGLAQPACFAVRYALGRRPVTLQVTVCGITAGHYLSTGEAGHEQTGTH